LKKQKPAKENFNQAQPKKPKKPQDPKNLPPLQPGPTKIPEPPGNLKNRENWFKGRSGGR
jgi:hypothetical protein